MSAVRGPLVDNKMKSCCVLFLLYVFVGCDSKTVDSPVVTVAEGKVKGAVKNLLDGSPYYSFKGIRYAEAPVGKLRFKSPLPAQPYDGVFEALEHGPVCPQTDTFSISIIKGNEDCLRLNVYTRTLQPEDKVPVMVFIHGGAYKSGSGDADTFGPEFLLQHDVILVTINYRLEVLGFLSLDTPEVPGNAGMKDQVTALRWVKNNIANFGGDPENVTIFGESAGSSSVTYHILSPRSKGLFQKAIAQSGVCIQDWAIGADAREYAFKVAKNLGKETDDVDELLEFLQSVPATSLTTQTNKIRSLDGNNIGGPLYFVPIVEKQFNVSDQFITEEPLQMLLEDKVNSVPLMIGYTSSEGMLLVRSFMKNVEIYNQHPSHFVPRDIVNKVSEEKQKELGEKIKKFYFGEQISPEDVVPVINLNTDLTFMYNIHRFVDFYTNLNSAVYLYRFDFSTQLNFLKIFFHMSKYDGACHADDLFYLFYNPINTRVYSDDKEKYEKIIYDITKLWTDFAKTGKPIPDSGIVKWSPYTRSGKEFFNINESWTQGHSAEKDRVEFWNKMYCEADLPCMA